MQVSIMFAGYCADHEASGYEENDESDPFLEFHHFDDDDFEVNKLLDIIHSKSLEFDSVDFYSQL